MNETALYYAMTQDPRTYRFVMDNYNEDDPIRQALLVMCYGYGLGVECDKAKAVRCLEAVEHLLPPDLMSLLLVCISTDMSVNDFDSVALEQVRQSLYEKLMIDTTTSPERDLLVCNATKLFLPPFTMDMKKANAIHQTASSKHLYTCDLGVRTVNKICFYISDS